MTESAKEPVEDSEAASDVGDVGHTGLVGQLGGMVRALLASPVGKSVVSLTSAILLIILVPAYAQIRLNRWNKPFFDALSRRDFREFLVQLGIFFLMASIILVLNVVQRWLVELLKLKL